MPDNRRGLFVGQERQEVMNHLAKELPTQGAARPLGSPGCDHYSGGEACSHQANELGICAGGLCPVTVEVTEEGRRALERKKGGAK